MVHQHICDPKDVVMACMIIEILEGGPPPFATAFIHSQSAKRVADDAVDILYFLMAFFLVRYRLRL